MNDDNTRLCARCLSTLSEGHGEFYEVTIDAVADPTPPVLEIRSDLDPQHLRDEYQQLADSFQNTSAQEAQDQVHRHVTISLCNRCFAKWIEDPAATS